MGHFIWKHRKLKIECQNNWVHSKEDTEKLLINSVWNTVHSCGLFRLPVHHVLCWRETCQHSCHHSVNASQATTAQESAKGRFVSQFTTSLHLALFTAAYALPNDVYHSISSNETLQLLTLLEPDLRKLQAQLFFFPTAVSLFPSSSSFSWSAGSGVPLGACSLYCSV